MGKRDEGKEEKKQLTGVRKTECCSSALVQRAARQVMVV